jgi:drug/metabolite transporter (DMT)-like permease
VIGASRRAMALMAGFALAWVVLEEVVGRRLQGHYHLMQIVWCRYAFHLLALVLLFGWTERSRLWRTRRPTFHLLRSTCMLVMPLTFALSLQTHVQPNSVWALFWLAPLAALLIARWTLAETVTPAVWVATAVATAAALAVLSPGADAMSPGAVLPLLMALSFAVYLAMTRRLTGEAVYANLFYTALGVFALLTPFMPMVWVTPSVGDAVVLGCIGVVGLLALFLLDRAVALAPLDVSTPFLFAHLLGSLAVGWYLLGRVPTHVVLAGATLVAAVLGVLWWRAARPHVPATIAFDHAGRPAP